MRESTEPSSRRPDPGAIAALVVQAGLHLLYAFHHRVNVDEPQHLHVSWAWTQGLLPYRDVFDNHAPLFHMLSAPILAAVGERPEIIVLMRLAMIPVVALGLWATYRIGCRIDSPRVALWAVALGGLWPEFVRHSVEYRADVLWMTAWVAALAVLVAGRLTPRRCFAGGVLLGITAAVSLKSVLLLASLAVAAIASLALRRKKSEGMPWRSMCARAASAISGLVVVPALIALYFASRGAWRPFLNGVVFYNLVPGLGLWASRSPRFLIFPIAVPILWLGARAVFRGAANEQIGVRRSAIFLTTALYFVVLESYWPLITGQDFLPFFPLAALLVVPGSIAALRRMAGRWRASRRLGPTIGLASATRLAPVLFAVLEVFAMFRHESPWRDSCRPYSDFLSDALHVSRPREYVMDLKGETVFRPRPFYYALEGVTLARMTQGLIRDTIADQIVATRTCVAVEDSDRLPPSARDFINGHFISVGGIRVVGTRLAPAEEDGAGSRSFEVIFPERFAVVSEKGSATGSLDGMPYDGPRELAAGTHEYRPQTSEGGLAVVWADAIERGFSPFPRPGTPR